MLDRANPREVYSCGFVLFCVEVERNDNLIVKDHDLIHEGVQEVLVIEGGAELQEVGEVIDAHSALV